MSDEKLKEMLAPKQDTKMNRPRSKSVCGVGINSGGGRPEASLSDLLSADQYGDLATCSFKDTVDMVRSWEAELLSALDFIRNPKKVVTNADIEMALEEQPHAQEMTPKRRPSFLPMIRVSRLLDNFDNPNKYTLTNQAAPSKKSPDKDIEFPVSQSEEPVQIDYDTSTSSASDSEIESTSSSSSLEISIQSETFSTLKKITESEAETLTSDMEPESSKSERADYEEYLTELSRIKSENKELRELYLFSCLFEPALPQLLTPSPSASGQSVNTSLESQEPQCEDRFSDLSENDTYLVPGFSAFDWSAYEQGGKKKYLWREKLRKMSEMFQDPVAPLPTRKAPKTSLLRKLRRTKIEMIKTKVEAGVTGPKAVSTIYRRKPSKESGTKRVAPIFKKLKKDLILGEAAGKDDTQKVLNRYKMVLIPGDSKDQHPHIKNLITKPTTPSVLRKQLRSTGKYQLVNSSISNLVCAIDVNSELSNVGTMHENIRQLDKKICQVKKHNAKMQKNYISNLLTSRTTRLPEVSKYIQLNRRPLLVNPKFRRPTKTYASESAHLTNSSLL